MQKRMLLAFTLALGFMISWTYIAQKTGMIEPPKKPSETPVDEVVEDLRAPEPGPVETSEPVADVTPDEGEASSEPEVPQETQAAQEISTLENDFFKVMVDNRGGIISYAVLKDYTYNIDSDRPVELAVPESHFPTEVLLERDVTTRDKMFEITARDGKSVTLTHEGPNLKMVKTYTMGDAHQLGLSVSVTDAAGVDLPYKMVVAEGLQRLSPTDKLKPGFLDFGEINPKIMYVAWSEGEKDRQKMPKQLDRISFRPVENEAPMVWLGIKDNYFASVFTPDTPVGAAHVKLSERYFPTTRKSLDVFVVAMEARGTTTGEFYMGPLKEADLAAVDARLDNIIDYGYAGLLSRWLFAGLDFFHDITGNWGWAIIILTFFIRLAVLPLMVPSVKSSFKMRALQPKMKKIQEQYKGDDLETKQKLQKAMWKLYKDEGVNPFSSCFTMLLQMPVFFAYFSLLRSSIYLRQAEWEWWITDLSIKDPTLVLPIIMGVTMWASTNAMPMTGGDPMQQRMMKLMPVMFSVMFIFMPSGLILYMITSNIFTYLQTKILHWRFAKA